MLIRIGAALLLGVLSSYAWAAGGDVALKTRDWSFSGPFGTFDKAAMQRGFQAYNEVCSGCHSLKLIAFRNFAVCSASASVLYCCSPGVGGPPPVRASGAQRTSPDPTHMGCIPRKSDAQLVCDERRRPRTTTLVLPELGWPNALIRVAVRYSYCSPVAASPEQKAPLSAADEHRRCTAAHSTLPAVRVSLQLRWHVERAR